MRTKHTQQHPTTRAPARATLTPKQRRDVTEIRERLVLTGAHLDHVESGYRAMLSGKTHVDRQDAADRLRRNLSSAKQNTAAALKVARRLDDRLAGKTREG